MTFFERPVLNSPYHLPERHWELDATGRPTDRILGARRSSELLTALPATSATSARGPDHHGLRRCALHGDDMSPSKIVNELRQELAVWRLVASPVQWNVTSITQRLLQHWRAIQADETPPIRPFFHQLEAGDR